MNGNSLMGIFVFRLLNLTTSGFKIKKEIYLWIHFLLFMLVFLIASASPMGQEEQIIFNRISIQEGLSQS
ncbi:MAG: hypothetical protein MUP98_03475, partial [Candidatus Aminicenantes bacterium]|nr:hypothetical protein [Candidatus Aminicenantes bacterium]